MDTNQVITEAVENNEEAIETAAKAISDAELDRYINTGMACWGVGILTGIALTKYVLTPAAAWVKEKWESRKPKVVEVKAEDKPTVEETTETEEPETKPSEEKPEEK